MKRKALVFFAVLLVLLSALGGRASAAEAEEELRDAIGTERLEKSVPESAEDVTGGMSVTDSLDVDGGIKRLTDKITGSIGKILKSTVKSGCTMLFAVMLSSAAVSFLGDRENVRNGVRIVTVLAVTAAAVTDMNSFIDIGKSTMDELNTFSKVLLPTMTAALTAAGAAGTAAVRYAATTMFLDVLITASNSLAVPLVYGYIAVSAASAAFGGKALSAAADLIKWLTNTLLVLIVSAFTLYLTLTGVVSASADAAAVKLTKTAISALPVVGGFISDAASVVLGAVTVLKNAVGIFGLLTVCSVCAIPLIRLGAHYLVYKGAAALSRTVADGEISDLIGAVGNAAGFIFGTVGACGMMLFISVVSVLRTVTG